MSADEVLLVAKRFTVVRQTRATPDGKLHVRETVQHPGAVVILPILGDGSICLIRNFRVAVGKTLLELPAGTLEPNEAPIVTAARELTEETGYRAGKLDKLTEFFMSPGILNERMHIFVATELTPGNMALEAGEEIEPLLVSWEEALKLVADGQIEDAKSVAGILFYDRFRRCKV